MRSAGWKVDDGSRPPFVSCNAAAQRHDESFAPRASATAVIVMRELDSGMRRLSKVLALVGLVGVVAASVALAVSVAVLGLFSVVG